MGEIVTIGVASLEEAMDRAKAAFSGEPQGSHVNFVSFDLMWRTLAPKRAAIVKAMTGKGPLSIREVARRVERDVKAVHSDVQRLIKSGIIDRTEDGKIIFPYDGIHVDFMLTNEAA